MREGQVKTKVKVKKLFLLNLNLCLSPYLNLFLYQSFLFEERQHVLLVPGEMRLIGGAS